MCIFVYVNHKFYIKKTTPNGLFLLKEWNIGKYLFRLLCSLYLENCLDALNTNGQKKICLYEDMQ